MYLIAGAKVKKIKEVREGRGSYKKISRTLSDSALGCTKA
jgi:hypothetical protein